MITVDEVIATCLPGNIGSCSILGVVLRERGAVQLPSLTTGQPVDLLSFGMTRAERDALPIPVNALRPQDSSAV